MTSDTKNDSGHSHGGLRRITVSLSNEQRIVIPMTAIKDGLIGGLLSEINVRSLSRVVGLRIDGADLALTDRCADLLTDTDVVTCVFDIKSLDMKSLDIKASDEVVVVKYQTMESCERPPTSLSIPKSQLNVPNLLKLIAEKENITGYTTPAIKLISGSSSSSSS